MMPEKETIKVRVCFTLEVDVEQYRTSYPNTPIGEIRQDIRTWAGAQVGENTDMRQEYGIINFTWME